MALVDYASSDEDAEEVDGRPSKRSKVEELPSLPDSFLDLYSSTVRTSSHDDPALHGGRKRIIPHVEGNWPTHIFLEWHPSQDEVLKLAKIVEEEAEHNKNEIHSLLRNQLGVTLPLHISLSRPLVLKTQQKDDYLARLKKAVSSSGIQCFNVHTASVVWHPNEDRSRYFLVAKLSRPSKDELDKLLDICNEIAKQFDQPLLYADSRNDASEHSAGIKRDHFHISIAWSLTQTQTQVTQQNESKTAAKSKTAYQALEAAPISIHFADVKVRIGQEVHVITLQRKTMIRENLFH